MQAQQSTITPASQERFANSAGWHESSFELRSGLAVTEADEAAGLELFRQWYQVLSARSKLH